MTGRGTRCPWHLSLARALGGALTAGVVAVSAPQMTLAQEPDEAANPEALEEIVITGSRIRRTGFETLQPAVVLGREELELNSGIDLATALNEQAGFSVPLVSPVDGQNADSIGQNYVDYLGLGQQRTLTLVNGQRFPAGVSPTSVGGLSVDLNMIPENLVERVETIAIGGAPIYGSDAISGTVNIILRDDFDGFEVFGTAGTSPEFTDGNRGRLGATWGSNFDNDRGNITLSTQYATADGLRQTDRPGTATGIGFEAPADPDSPYALDIFDDLKVAVDNVRPFPLLFGDQFAFNIFGNGVPLDINDPDSPITQFDADGNLIPFVPGGGTGSVIFQNGGDGLSLSDFTQLYNDIERYNVTGFLKYDLTESVSVNAEGWFSRTEATEVVNQPIFNSSAFGGLPADGFGNVGSGPIPVLLDNPFLTDATRNTIGAALDVLHDENGDGAADPTIDTDGDGVADAVGFWRGGPNIGVVGDFPNHTKRDTVRGVLGLEGDLDLGGREYYWDVYATYGRTQAEDFSLDLVQTRFDQAIQVVTDTQGNPACADPSDGCVPLNVVGTPTPEAVDYVSELVRDEVTITQRVLSANISGDLFDMPAGPLAAAGGFTYREESAAFDPNDLAENGFTRAPLVAINGEFDTTEFYVETVIPLLGGDLDMPLVESLEFEGAVRFVDNSVAGQDTTWTAGLRYRPIEDIELRGNLTESIRAPSITELFTPESTVFVFADDPCDERFIDQGNVPDTRAANCAAAGITQPFQSFIVNASQEATLSGNPELDSEIAESSTYGVVLRPRFLNNFTMSVDWFDIEIANAIENLQAVDILNACYDSSAFPAEAACGLFTRDAAGQINSMQTGFINVGLVEFKGLQTSVSYLTGLGNYGDLNLSLNHLFTDEQLETPGSGNTVQLDGTIGRSTHRVSANATWSIGDWKVFNQFRWLDGAVFDNADDEFSRTVPGVGSWFVMDTGVAYSLNENIDLQLNIDNLLDREMPYPAAADANGITTYFSGVMGRYATFTVRAGF
ncbi:MAG: TonB-dependent receptor domain-containing protein [Woeseiaceae bacterium]